MHSSNAGSALNVQQGHQALVSARAIAPTRRLGHKTLSGLFDTVAPSIYISAKVSQSSSLSLP